MGKADESYYVAMRQKDLPRAYVNSVGRECFNCREKVWIHYRLIAIADKSKGIICSPCVQELQNKSMPELIVENVENIVDILKEEL